MADNRLYDQTRKWSGNPKNRDIINFCTQCLKYPRYVRVLESESKLNSKKTYTHVPYLLSAKFRLARRDRCSRKSCRHKKGIESLMHRGTYTIALWHNCTNAPLLNIYITNPFGRIAPFFTTTIPSFTVYSEWSVGVRCGPPLIRTSSPILQFLSIIALRI